ncbi:MAG: hypothetical protein LBC53_07255 [Spirochaetaceae bacterium]|jgi:class 3 adenylate cyclase|nr:hypothetical protein [Spirochaetaceae bacterium]
MQKERKIKNKTFIICLALVSLFAAVCVCNVNLLKRPIFQTKMRFESPSVSRYDIDGNLYVIDDGAFRITCMNPQGRIRYNIIINKSVDYTRFFDMAADEAGNVYVYAMEGSYTEYITIKDVVRQYNNKGEYVRDIYSIEYAEDDPERPHLFPQFGSMRYSGGMLTFSRTRESAVDLFIYDTFNNKLTTAVYTRGAGNFSIARLALKDFNNFIYTTRSGEIYEVLNNELFLRASFNCTLDEGGVIPWFITYDENSGVIFMDVHNSIVCRIEDGGAVPLLPRSFFDSLAASVEGGHSFSTPSFNGARGRFGGFFGDVVWYYDGSEFITYNDGALLPKKEAVLIAIVQCSFVLMLLMIAISIYILYVYVYHKFVSIFIKQSILIIPLISVAFFLFYSTTFNSMNSRLDSEVIQKMNLFTATVVALINPSDIEAIKGTKDFETEEYLNLRRQIKAVVNNNKDEWNKNFYAAIFMGEEFNYTLVISNDESGIMHRTYALEYGSEEYNAFISEKNYFAVGELPDGKFAASEVPIFNAAGEVVGMFELGLNMNSYQIANAKQSRSAALFAAVICVVILIVIAITAFMIVKQLSFFSRVLKCAADGDYSARVSYSSRDELGVVSNGLNGLVSRLETQIRHIQKMNESTMRFVPIQFMEYLGVTDITKMSLGDNVQRIMSILFFDIRAFSINSEIMTVEENFMFINKVLGVSGPIIRKHNGFVDKFLGDAAMALFLRAHDAVLAGIEIYDALVLDGKLSVKVGVDNIGIGVGVNTGSVMMGIVGEKERFSGTVISKNVNMASRLESLTKQVGAGMLISSGTMNEIHQDVRNFDYRFIGMIQAAGLNEAVGVFDILSALPPDVKEKRVSTKQLFESGVRNFHTKKYEKAAERFTQVLHIDPDDVCASRCLEETKLRMENPHIPSVFLFDKK